MNYPLKLRFKLFALAPQIFVQDAAGADVCYVKQKLLRLREKVEVFTNESRQQLLCTIAADRVIDFSATYNFRTPDGAPIGSVRRRGLRSIWKAHYQVMDSAGQPEFEIHEINPFAKIMDSILGEIPILGMFSGFFFNPKYAVTQNGNQLLTMTKHRAFLESKFSIEQTSPVSASGRATFSALASHVCSDGAQTWLRERDDKLIRFKVAKDETSYPLERGVRRFQK